MEFLLRILRFYNQESMGWPFGCLFAIGCVVFRWHDRQSSSILVVGLALAFFAPYFVRHLLIRHYAQVREALYRGSIILTIVLVAAIFVGSIRVAGLSVAVYGALMLGVLFWCSSDPMYKMMNWLAFPTEYGRWPDEIELVDQRSFHWPVASEQIPVYCYLFRFRYDDKWRNGIVGPITFSMFEDMTDKSPEEIYANYADWYKREGIGEMIEKEGVIDDEDND